MLLSKATYIAFKLQFYILSALVRLGLGLGLESVNMLMATIVISYKWRLHYNVEMTKYSTKFWKFKCYNIDVVILVALI